VCHERDAEEGVQRQERVILGNGAEKDERKAFMCGLQNIILYISCD